MKTLMFIGTTLGSWIGWSIGDYLSAGDIFVSFIVSSLFAALGVYGAWRFGRSMD